MTHRVFVKLHRQPWLLAPCVAALSPGAPAQDLHVTVGLKTWTNTWTTWGLAQSQYSAASYETVTPLESDTQVSLIPQLSLRWRSWLVSASYMTQTDYGLSAAFPAQYFTELRENRHEVDGNLGYYVLPGVAVTVGYKELDQNAGGPITWSGPTVGLAGTVPLNFHRISAYGTLGYGFFRLKVPDLPDASGRTSFQASYLLAEVGAAWTVVDHLTLTAGYRTQTARARGYALSMITYNGTAVSQPYGSTSLRDLTQGLTVGVAASF